MNNNGFVEFHTNHFGHVYLKQMEKCTTLSHGMHTKKVNYFLNVNIIAIKQYVSNNNNNQQPGLMVHRQRNRYMQLRLPESNNIKLKTNQLHG